MLTIVPLVEVMRIDDNGYGSKYHTLLTILWLDPEIVFLCAFLGSMTRANYEEFYGILKSRGVKSTARIRHGKLEIKEIK